MADNAKQSGGRRIVSQAEAEAVAAKAGVDPITRTTVESASLGKSFTRAAHSGKAKPRSSAVSATITPYST